MMNLKNEKILITGGSGFIGTNLIDLLIKYNTDFVNIDKNAPKKNKHFDFWHEINILNTKKLEFKINEYKPTILIHLAGRTDTFGKKLRIMKIIQLERKIYLMLLKINLLLIEL